jgi:hypothetical protein
MPTSSSSTQVLAQQLVLHDEIRQLLASGWPTLLVDSFFYYNNKKKNAQKINVQFSSRADALGPTHVYRFHGGTGESRVYLCYFPP